jgi:hypothetical protein
MSDALMDMILHKTESVLAYFATNMILPNRLACQAFMLTVRLLIFWIHTTLSLYFALWKPHKNEEKDKKRN